MNETNIQRNYKDSLFRMLFREKQELLSLYNALNNSSYQDPDALIIHSLENVLYMGMKNDVSFLIDAYLNLYEAQSTWNPNMPLRDVFYLADLYKGYVSENNLDIYSSTQLRIPTPRCIVFYNGLKKMEDVKIVRLSESFIHPTKQEPALECTVTYLNINFGHNQEIMEQCRKLYEYSFLIDQIRGQLAGGKQLEAAVEYAVEYCIANNVLTDFLTRHRAEVTSVILSEYNAEQHIRNEKEISYQDGFSEGHSTGLEKGILSFTKLALKQGMSCDEICKLLIEEFQLNESQAKYYIDKFSNSI